MTNTGIYIDTTVKTTANSVNSLAITTDDHLIVASTGSLVALGDFSTALHVSGSDASAEIYGQLYSASGDALMIDFGSDSFRGYVNGSISGITGILDLGTNDQIFIGAQGNIFGYLSGALLDGNDLLSNAGHVFGAGTGEFGTGTAFEIAGANAHVVNSGYAEGSVTAVILSNNNANDFTIDNTGIMRGGVALLSGVTATGITINNDGTWTAANGFNLSNGADAVSNSGFMRGNIVMNGGDDTLTNTGHIRGAVNLGIGANAVVNSGTMGAVSFFGAADSLTNNGAILGNVAMNSGTVINNGTIAGYVTFTGGSNSLDNGHGEITGGVFGGSGNDNFTGGRFDDNFNGGGGNDTLRGGSGDDTLNGSGGKDTLIGGIGDDQLTGGAAADTFTFNGGFGHDVITDFTATGGSADTILFRHDFGSFAAVQAHMAQVGTSVVITLDSGHAIVLEGVTTASLTAGNFSFG